MKQSKRLAEKQEPRTVQIIFQPVGRAFELPYNETLFEAAARAGVEVDTACGGNGACGKCKVRLDTPPPATPLDHIHLSNGEIRTGYRLSCQVQAKEDMVVYVPSGGNRASVEIVHEGLFCDVELRPNVSKLYIPYTPPRRRSGIADWDSVKEALPSRFQSTHMALHWLRQLPDYIRHKEGMTLVVAGRKVIRLEMGDTTPHHYGVAFDIGSTTVVGYLINLNTGEEIAVISGVNEQVKYGDDVIVRLSKTQHNPAALEMMHRLIVDQLNHLLQKLAGEARIDVRQINEVTVVGNMTMHHFLLRLDSTYLGLSPYAPVVRDGITVSAGELGLILEADTPVYALPNIAGFVGSDTIGVILAGELHRSQGLRLAIDVGTNSEVVLGSKTRLTACSAPAGPAFEGGRIKHGMRATIGAIDHATIEQDVSFSVIGDVTPRGICGSGLVDLVAGLLQVGLIDSHGRLLRRSDLAAGTPTRLEERLVEFENRRHNYFIVAYAKETGAKQDIILTQADIREFQLAKGAIRAGAMVLQQTMGLKDEDLDEVLLAGGFGAFLDLANTRRVNLVPQVPLERLRSIGNAAGVGARLALISTGERLAAERIGRQIEHIRLSGLSPFNKALIQAMRFPELYEP